MKNQEIGDAFSTLLCDIADCDDKYCEDEVISWFVAAVLRIWAGNKLFSQTYVEALSSFTNKTYTTTQVMTTLDLVSDESLKIKVPEFFQNIVSKDIKSHTCKSRTLADSIGRFLVQMALINGDFTIDEASALKEINDILLDYCDSQGVASGKTREYHPEMVTLLKAESYTNPTMKENNKPIKREEMQNNDNSDLNNNYDEFDEDDYDDDYDETEDDDESDDSTPTITFNLRLVADSSDDDDDFDDSDDEDNNSGYNKTERNEDSDDTLDSVLNELHNLVGLDKVKNDIQSLLNFIKICQMRTKRGMKVPTVSYHLVFTGNPGTGKTTVARLVARLYYLMGILPEGQLVETDRSGLVAGYLGQTAIKTQKVIQEALGGVLFIDEAYSLVNDDDDSYGKEAIETILKAMEDHRDELVVIVAGYDELMHKFIDSNPGLRARFNKYFNFPDYDGNDLLQIFKRFCDANGYTVAEDAIPHLQSKLNDMYEHREEHFGNACAIRNLFEHSINNQANRLVLDNDITDCELAELTLDDILPAIEVI